MTNLDKVLTKDIYYYNSPSDLGGVKYIHTVYPTGSGNATANMGYSEHSFNITREEETTMIAHEGASNATILLQHKPSKKYKLDKKDRSWAVLYFFAKALDE